ncbi:MAG: hypothetical protein ACK4S4_10960 [Pyrinomonadaceae bacterium]
MNGYFPGKLQAVAIVQTVIGSLQIVGSIFLAVWVLIFGIATFGVGLIMIPIPIVYLIVGILSLVAGIKGLQRTPAFGLSFGVAIAQMFGIFLCDVVSFGCGLAGLILLLQPEVKSYYGR